MYYSFLSYGDNRLPHFIDEETEQADINCLAQGGGISESIIVTSIIMSMIF